MSSVTDWLTSIGTISAVVVSLSYAVLGRFAEKKRKRRRIIWRLGSLSEKLYHEIETTQQNESTKAIAELETYKAFKIYQSVILFSADSSNEDVLVLGENMLEAYENYYADKSEEQRAICLDLIKQVKTLK